VSFGPGRVGLALLSAALGMMATATGAERDGDAYTVTYRSRASVYVSAGRAAGLAVGDRLAVTEGARSVAELEVVFVAQHSSSSRIVTETRAVKVGDRVTRVPASGSATPTAPAPPPAPAPPEAVAATEASLPPPVAYARRPPPVARVRGSASIGWSNFHDTTEAARHVEERMVRYGVLFGELGGQPLDLTVRGSHRHALRDGLRATVVPRDERWDRLYEASLAYAPPGRAYSLRAGRLAAWPFTSVGYLDGVLGGWRAASGLQVGGFAGRTADAEDTGVESGSKYGAFVRLGSGRGPAPWDLFLSGAAERSGSEISREYLGQEAQVRRGTLWLYERVEVDFNRGWRRERAGSGAQLSDARVRVSWRPSSPRALSASWERHRNFWSAFNRSLPPALFDDRVYQTVRADLDWSRPGGVAFSLGGSVRTREGDADRAYAVHLGARTPRLGGLAASADASAYQTLYTRGLLATLRAGQDLAGGHRADLSYTVNWYEPGGSLARRLGHWLRLSGYGQFARQAFARADLEYALGDDVEGIRVLIEAGYRF
jgi:hypothetical protein